MVETHRLAGSNNGGSSRKTVQEMRGNEEPASSPVQRAGVWQQCAVEPGVHWR